MAYRVYILRCADGSLYTGITTDLQRRLAEHNHSDTLGARYTRSRRPVELLASQALPDRRSASQLEYQLKRMRRSQKLAWVEQQPSPEPAEGP